MQMTTKFVVPEGVEFAALALGRTAEGAISFDWAPIEAVCAASGIDIALLREQDEGNVAGLIVAWYMCHRELGGAPDATAEDLLAEAHAEDDLGGGYSHEPGRA